MGDELKRIGERRDFETYPVVSLFILMGLIAVYFLPSIIAALRHHRNIAAIVILNTLTGWTFIGWVATLVWAFTVSSIPSGPIQVVVTPQRNMFDEPPQRVFELPPTKSRALPPPPPITEKTSMYRCSKCKTPILNTKASFCSGCGSPISKRGVKKLN